MVAQVLCVEIMHLERRVVHMRRRVGAHEEAVVVDVLLSTIDVCEHSNDAPLAGFSIDIEKVTWHHVEMRRVEFEDCVEVLDAETVMAELMENR
jgi:hypothetical protein